MISLALYCTLNHGHVTVSRMLNTVYMPNMAGQWAALLLPRPPSDLDVSQSVCVLYNT
jgi:hypothetical protein